MGSEPHLVWDLGAELGEGPAWVERDSALWFTDIKRQRIYRFDPASGDQRSWHAPELVGFVLPAASGGLVVGLQSGLHRFDPHTGKFELLAAVEADKPTNRINDGVVDAAGRLWFGTLDNREREKTGAFYRYERGRLHPTGIDGICITNGPAVSPDGRTLYWVNTLGGTISACPIREDGSLGPSRVAIRIDPKEGHPDGPTVDCEGCIWIGLYAGWEARRYTPSGELLERVRFPTANITKLAFGGPDLSTLYATSARQSLAPEQIEEQPLAGGLFAFRAAVAGVASPLIAD